MIDDQIYRVLQRKVEVYLKKDLLDYFVQIDKELRKVLYSNIYQYLSSVSLFPQILMNVQPIHVTLMVLVPTLLEPFNVHVIKATVAMALFALVCKIFKLMYPFIRQLFNLLKKLGLFCSR